jgi:4-hydroxy 2-oxovalerate aldolase
MAFKLLDCTLRDGGYYTNWDFDKSLVATYIDSFNRLPIDYLEVGYRSMPMKEYLGEFFYCPIYVLEEIKKQSNKKLVVILNEKDVRPEHVKALLEPCKGLIDMVRIALDPQQLRRAITLAAEIKKYGFEVGFNVMYMSKWNQYGDFLNELKYVDEVADYFYLVDSFGGVYPNTVRETISMVKERTNCKLGFHGHNNMELALMNSLTAIECGVDIVDATVTGMGRGAGNLKTELLFTALNATKGLEVDFDALGKVVDAFQKLQAHHGWGTNLPYMISGANSLPQKDVMEWVTHRFYSFNSIIRALQNQKAKRTDNEQLPVFKVTKKFKKALIVGGGPNAALHADGIRQFIARHPDMCIIHASSKNAGNYKHLPNAQFFCLVGSEGHRLEKVFSDLGSFDGKCVLPPFPRKMGTYIPNVVKDIAFELAAIDFTDRLFDSHTVLALQTSLSLGVEEIFFAGYDGYQGDAITQLEIELAEENEYSFSMFRKNTSVPICSITPTAYKNIGVKSVYSDLI